MKEGIRVKEKKQSDVSVLLGYAGSYKKLTFPSLLLPRSFSPGPAACRPAAGGRGRFFGGGITGEVLRSADGLV